MGLPRAIWDLRRAKTSLCILFWLEHKFAASLLAQSRDFYRCHLHQLVTVKPDFFFFWYRQMRNCLSVKFRRRVCQILRANTGNSRKCGSACGITSATLTYKWLARAVRVASFNSRCSKSNLDSVGDSHLVAIGYGLAMIFSTR